MERGCIGRTGLIRMSAEWRQELFFRQRVRRNRRVSAVAFFEVVQLLPVGSQPRKSINTTTHNDLKPALQVGPTLSKAEKCQRRLSVSVRGSGARVA